MSCIIESYSVSLIYSGIANKFYVLGLGLLPSKNHTIATKTVVPDSKLVRHYNANLHLLHLCLALFEFVELLDYDLNYWCSAKFLC